VPLTRHMYRALRHAAQARVSEVRPRENRERLAGQGVTIVVAGERQVDRRAAPHAFTRGPHPSSSADVAQLLMVNGEQFDDGLAWRKDDGGKSERGGRLRSRNRPPQHGIRRP